MKRLVWRTPRAGAIRRLALCEESLPSTDPGMVRIGVRSVGLNFADIFALTGLYSATPQGSFIPGLEFSGVVMETVPGAHGFSPGDPVMGVTRFGGYASVLDVAPAYCMPLPAGWTFAQGAAFPAQTLTAWYALKVLGDVKPGQAVLVQSAAGGVGLQALHLCLKSGVRPIGAVGSAAKREFLRQRGFPEVVVRGRNFKNDVRALLGGQNLNLVLDAVGGRYQKEGYELLAPTGRLVVFGAAEFTPGRNRPRYLKALVQYLRRPVYDPLNLISSNRSVLGFNLIWLWDRLDMLLPLLEDLLAMKLEAPCVGKGFPFSEAHAAIDFLRSGQSVGKVVLTLPESTPS